MSRAPLGRLVTLELRKMVDTRAGLDVGFHLWVRHPTLGG